MIRSWRVWWWWWRWHTKKTDIPSRSCGAEIDERDCHGTRRRDQSQTREYLWSISDAFNSHSQHFRGENMCIIPERETVNRVTFLQHFSRITNYVKDNRVSCRRKRSSGRLVGWSTWVCSSHLVV